MTFADEGISGTGVGKRAIEHGVVLGNNRIWGYEKREGRLVIKEEEASIVHHIFDLYAN